MPSGTFDVSNNSAGLETEIRWSTSDDSANNRSTLTAELWARRSSSTTFGTGSWTITIDGTAYGRSGTVSIGTTFVRVATASKLITHNPDGSRQAGISVSGGIPGTSWSSTSGSATVTLTNYVRVPSAPGQPTTSNVTPTGMRWDFGPPSFYGNGILEYRLRYSLSSTFASGVTTVSTGLSRNYTASTLTPGSTYYAQASARNVDGWGPWSSTRAQATLSSSAPGVSVSSNIPGTAATVTLTPPGGASGVTEYNIEYRPVGGSATATSTTGSTKEITGLTPGGAYEYRANAEFGASYTSPWSNWVAFTQANPNTNPGDYFDGSTTDKPGIDYGWTGTVNNSTSTASGKPVTGWTTVFANGAAGAMYQVAGGFAGSYAARVWLTAGSTSAGGVLAGQDSGVAYRSAVEPDTTYVGSIHVNPSRSQRLAARIIWYDAGGGVVGTADGTAEVVASGGWTRLAVAAVAPSNADTAIVRVIDVTGTGWAVWNGGDWLDVDAAMISLAALFSYFDGSTADTPNYNHVWTGTANASTSARYTLTPLPVDPLADPDCPPLPAPPTPPVIVSDCIDEVGTWRRYTSQIAESEVRQWSATLPTIELHTDTQPERQVRIRLYPNPEGVAPELVDTTNWDAELIVTYIPPQTVLTLDGVTERVWAAPGHGADTIAANHLLYGTGGVPATWPILRCGIGYVFTFDVPLDTPSGNLHTHMYLTPRQ